MVPPPKIPDTPTRSHCVVISLTTTDERPPSEVAYWIRTSMLRSGKVHCVMAGPAGGLTPGESEAYALASACLRLDYGDVPEEIRPLVEKFRAAVEVPDA